MAKKKAKAWKQGCAFGIQHVIDLIEHMPPQERSWAHIDHRLVRINPRQVAKALHREVMQAFTFEADLDQWVDGGHDVSRLREVAESAPERTDAEQREIIRTVVLKGIELLLAPHSDVDVWTDDYTAKENAFYLAADDLMPRPTRPTPQMWTPTPRSWNDDEGDDDDV